MKLLRLQIKHSNMLDFPILKDTQVALVRAEIATGHILTEDFKLNLAPSPVPYTIFENIEDAVSYAREISNKRKDVEFAIYDKTKKRIKYLLSSDF